MSSKFHPREEDKSLPVRPRRTTRVELENSQSREALVLGNAKLLEENTAMELEIQVLYLQVSQYSEILKKYKAAEFESAKSMRRISRTVNAGVTMQADTISELDVAQSDANYHWEEFVRMKRYSGVFVEKVIEDIKNRVTGASSEIDVRIDLNRF
jgi:hypothetical protein